jgi:hypothetical protein
MTLVFAVLFLVLAHMAVAVLHVVLAHKLLFILFVASVAWTWLSLGCKNPFHVHISQPLQESLNRFLAGVSLTILVSIRDGMDYLQHGIAQSGEGAAHHPRKRRSQFVDAGDAHAQCAEQEHASTPSGWTRSGKVRRPESNQGAVVDLTD